MVINPSQEDVDADSVGDSCDNCVDVYNPDQADTDGDSIGDSCDMCTDSDGDGYGDPGFPDDTCTLDNCPDTANPDQADTRRWLDLRLFEGIIDVMFLFVFIVVIS